MSLETYIIVVTVAFLVFRWILYDLFYDGPDPPKGYQFLDLNGWTGPDALHIPQIVFMILAAGLGLYLYL